MNNFFNLYPKFNEQESSNDKVINYKNLPRTEDFDLNDNIIWIYPEECKSNEYYFYISDFNDEFNNINNKNFIKKFNKKCIGISILFKHNTNADLKNPFNDFDNIINFNFFIFYKKSFSILSNDFFKFFFLSNFNIFNLIYKSTNSENLIYIKKKKFPILPFFFLKK